MADVIVGQHRAEPNTILIQIQDFGTWQFAAPKHTFDNVYQFTFNDHENPDLKTNITVEQAAKIAEILTSALAADANVVVHCHAGLCRSGAVVEVGIMMGFDEVHSNRQPNVLVKNRLRDALGLTTNYEELFKDVE